MIVMNTCESMYMCTCMNEWIKDLMSAWEDRCMNTYMNGFVCNDRWMKPKGMDRYKY